jgi:hypothetical protein
MKKAAAIVLGLALFGSTPEAEAGPIIFESQPPDLRFAYFGDADYTYDAAAAMFSLNPGATTIGDAHWWGGCYQTAPGSTDFASPSSGIGPSTCPPGNFVLRFYENTHNGTIDVPGTLIQEFVVGDANQTATAADRLIGGFITEYSYFAQFTPFTLSDATPYWFAVSNMVVNTTWGMESAGGEDSHTQRRMSDGVWLGVNDNLAFQLTGPEPTGVPVPEPATLSLLGVGSAIGAVRIWRRRIRNAAH